VSADRPSDGKKLPRPRKRLGQHFLSDRNLLGRIADAAGATRTDTVIEIGPGRGALTEQLLARAGRVIAIELDRDLVPLLRARWEHEPRLTVVEGDVLEQNLHALAGGPYLLVGNVPYNITTPIIFHAMRRPRPARAVYLVQQEVAERVVALPGAEDYGALSANVQALAKAERLFGVAAKSFTPPPKVESAVLRITPREDPVITAEEEDDFRRLVIGAFGLRRKQMRRVLRTLWSLGAEEADAVLARAGIGAAVRPETLGAPEFAKILRARSGWRMKGER
jgi:16S rRNA (adenine1518-N6/adenine1519-N6)-dimethyltransferase